MAAGGVGGALIARAGMALAMLAFGLAARAATPLSLVDHPGELPIAGHADWFQEDGPRLSLDRARAVFAAGQARASDSAFLDFGLGARPAWLRLVVFNRGDGKAARRLSIDNPWLDDIEVSLVHEGRLQASWRMGDAMPFDQRPVPGRFFAVDAMFEPGATEVYIRAASPDPLVLPIFLMPPAEAAAREQDQGMSYGFLYGYLGALIAFNAIIYLGIRDRRYALYATFLATFIALNVAYTGHGFAALWPERVDVQRWVIPILMVAYPLAGFAFARVFLDTPSSLPRTARAIRMASIAGAVALAAAVAFGKTQLAALWVAFVFVTFFSFAMLGMGAYAFRRGVPSSGYFLLASLASMAGTALTSLAVWGWIDFSPWKYRAVELGTLVDATLLALALASQFRHTERARAAADRARLELTDANQRLNETLQEVERLATTDRLTGLANRLHLERVAAAEMERAARYGHALSLLAIDLDNFKVVNDTHGHHAGDEVLVEVAQLARLRVRESDLVTRWGGEEFLVLMPNTTLEEARVAAEALRRVFETYEFLHGVRLTVSIGVAQWRSGTENVEAWIARADRALYRAKGEGRNRCELDCAVEGVAAARAG